MFNRLFSKPKPTPGPVRDTLFGDMPLERWASETAPQEFPWNAFAQARDYIAASDVASAVGQWRQVAAAADLEPRHYLQAWHFLRQHGCQPPSDIAKQVLGVVVEVGMPTGLDLLAAYADHSARYYNYSGSGVIWEHPNSSLDLLIDTLLSSSAQVAGHIGPWDKNRPAAPPTGQMRLSILTPTGLHFGQASMEALAADPLAGPAVQCATRLMQALIATTNRNA